MPNNSNPSAPVARVLSHCDMVKQSTNGWMARCPAHEDKKPSLGIKQGDDGKALLKCFAGCTFEKIVAALCLVESELMGEGESDYSSSQSSIALRSASKSTKAKKGFPSASDALKAYRGYLGKEASYFTYRNANGTPIGIVARWNKTSGGKEYRPAFLIEGEWMPTYPKTRPLFALDKLANADKSKPVYLMEGEKCAELIEQLGFVATTAPQGSSGAASVDLSPLEGRKVIIIPDADNAGETYAATIQTRLRQLPNPPIQILLLQLPEAKPNSGDDIEQFLSDRHNDDTTAAAEELNTLAAIGLGNIKVLGPPVPKMQTALELMRSPDFHLPPQTVNCNWIPFDAVQPFGGLECGTLTVLSAPPACYKTSAMLRIARGYAEEGFRVRWLAAEMRPSQLAKRMLTQAAGLELRSLWVPIPQIQVKLKTTKQRLERAFSQLQFIRGPIGFDEIRNAAAEADIVFVDYLQLIRHPESKIARHEQLEQIMETCIEACQSTKTVFIMASSQSRGGGNERDISSAFKGSSAIEFSADVAYCATAPSKEELEAGTFNLRFECFKQREGERFEFEVPIEKGIIALTDEEKELNS